MFSSTETLSRFETFQSLHCTLIFHSITLRVVSLVHLSFKDKNGQYPDTSVNKLKPTKLLKKINEFLVERTLVIQINKYKHLRTHCRIRAHYFEQKCKCIDILFNTVFSMKRG